MALTKDYKIRLDFWVKYAINTLSFIKLGIFMKQHKRWLALFLASTIVFSPIAEAKRAGGGKNHGMARQTNSQQASPTQIQPAPQRTNTTPAQAQGSNGSNVGKMVAAGVAGAAVGALAANAMADNGNGEATGETTKEESSSFGWLFWLVLAGLAFAAYRFFSKKKLASANQANPYAPNNAGQYQSPTSSPINARTASPTSGDNTNIFGQPVGSQAPTASQNLGGVYTNSGQALPDGTEPAAFLRVARQRFNHIQAMNSASNIEEIRRYLTPDLYQSMYQDIMDNQDENVAEFSNLNAMVADSATENGQYIVSVRFTGTVSEDLNSLPQPFTEIWHFVKPVDSNGDWLVAGIQQA